MGDLPTGLARSRTLRRRDRCPAAEDGTLERGAMNPMILVLASLLATPAAPVASDDFRLTLDEATRMALQNDEALQIDRESLSAATAAVRGSHGAYDQVLEVSGTWQKSR